MSRPVKLKEPVINIVNEHEETMLITGIPVNMLSDLASKWIAMGFEIVNTTALNGGKTFDVKLHRKQWYDSGRYDFSTLSLIQTDIKKELDKICIV